MSVLCVSQELTVVIHSFYVLELFRFEFYSKFGIFVILLFNIIGHMLQNDDRIGFLYMFKTMRKINADLEIGQPIFSECNVCNL